MVPPVGPTVACSVVKRSQFPYRKNIVKTNEKSTGPSRCERVHVDSRFRIGWCVSVRVSLARARSVPTGLGCLPCLPAPHTSTVLHQARAALWIGPPAAAVLNHFEDRRVATPEHARPRPRGTSASGTLRMRLTRWRRDVMQSKAPPSYHSSTPRGPGSFGVFSQRCFIRTVGKSHAKHGSGSTDSVDNLSFISECRSDQLSCAF